MGQKHDFDLPAHIVPIYAAVSASSSGNNTLVAAVVGKKILVFNCVLIASGTVDAIFQDGAGGAGLSGTLPLTTNSGFTAPFSEIGWTKTSTNTLLNLNLSGAVSVGGFLVYAEIP